MECLRNFIGILGCNQDQPESGLVINSLPGIPIEFFNMIVNAQQKTYLQAWDDIQSRALIKLNSAIISEFKKKIKIKTITQSFDLGKKIDLVTAATAAGTQQRGFTIECEYPSIEWITSSALRMISIQELHLYLGALPATGPVILKIFDLDTKEVLKTISVLKTALSVGWNRIPVNSVFDAERVGCVYYSNEIDSRQLPINPLLQNTLSSFINSWVGSRCHDCDPCQSVIRGFKSDADFSNEAFGTSAFGLSGIFSIVCKYDSLVCANKMSFATPYLYLLGAEGMVQALYDKSRINKWTLDEEGIAQLRDYYQTQFETELANVIEGIDLNLSDICLDCNDQIQIVQQLP